MVCKPYYTVYKIRFCENPTRLLKMLKSVLYRERKEDFMFSERWIFIIKKVNFVRNEKS